MLHYLLEAFKVVGEIIVAILILAAVIEGVKEGRRESRQATGLPGNKKYRMRGYGGDPAKYTSLHPRQAAMGRRIVFIPGVGFRHVTPGKRKKP